MCVVEFEGVEFAEMRVADEAGEDGFCDRDEYRNMISPPRHIRAKLQKTTSF